MEQCRLLDCPARRWPRGACSESCRRRHPGVVPSGGGQLVSSAVSRRTDGAAAPSVAGHRRRWRRARGLAHRHRQDAHGVPRGHRRRLSGEPRPDVRPKVSRDPVSSTSHPYGRWLPMCTRTFRYHWPVSNAKSERLGLAAPALRVAVRTGDTPAAERTAMRRNPPDLLVTTPESLYLLLTAPSSRSMLRGVHTVIVDEVHTLARDKRGSHLALSLERLTALVEQSGGRLQRIGLSATQRPLSVVARLLSGTDSSRPACTIIDCGHQRDLDVAIELPVDRARGGGERRPTGRRPRPHRRPRARTPDHPHLRQHPQECRARCPPAGRATGCPPEEQDGQEGSQEGEFADGDGRGPPVRRSTRSMPRCR